MNKFIIGLLLLNFYLIGDAQITVIVRIGEQGWTKHNLNVDKFRNGDIIPYAKTDDEWKAAGNALKPAWCYCENKSENGIAYGKLYNWYAIKDSRGLAPVGYHIPSDSEWTVLANYLGGEEIAGNKMKSTTGWESYNGKKPCNNCKDWTDEYRDDHTCNICKGSQKVDGLISGNGTNSSGFAGLPGGFRNANGLLLYFGISGNWWSSSEDSTKFAWNRFLINSNLLSSTYDKQVGMSVRCLRD